MLRVLLLRAVWGDVRTAAFRHRRSHRKTCHADQQDRLSIAIMSETGLDIILTRTSGWSMLS
jgi:hypothetical protein